MQKDHPFPCAPGQPCYAATRHSSADVETVFRAAREALVAMSAAHVAVDEARSRTEATFRVLVFRNDVSLEVRPSGSGATLYVRSRSRVGGWDLGVNRRRVKTLLRHVTAFSGPLREA